MLRTDNVVPRAEWDAARATLLEREKQLTRLSDELAAERRELPWTPVDREYTLDTADGPRTLGELFDGRSQLAVYHFMFGPEFVAGCPVNSSIADAFDPLVAHLAARDVTMLCVSRAPIGRLLAYRARMGWSFNWASSHRSGFSFDYGGASRIEDSRAWLEEARGQLPPVALRNAAACGVDLATYISEGYAFQTFARDGDDVYLTYSAGARGVEFLMSYYAILDRVPSGRDEGAGFQTWLERHDEYDRG